MLPHLWGGARVNKYDTQDEDYPPFAEAVFICFHVEHPALKNVPRLRTVDNDDQLLHFTLDEPF